MITKCNRWYKVRPEGALGAVYCDTFQQAIYWLEVLEPELFEVSE